VAVAINRSDLILYYVLGVTTILVLLFALAFIKDLIDPEFDIPAGIYPLLTIPIGGLTGYAFNTLTDRKTNRLEIYSNSRTIGSICFYLIIWYY
jgi:hypothetical protein